VATIDGEEYVITESLVRAQLQLDDEGGDHEVPKEEILAGLQAVGCAGDGKVWYKNQFCPKWRFLTHTLLKCMSSKFGGWDQFSTDIALAIVCLSQGRSFNFSKYIFDEMVKNVKDTKLKFLMYPRFLQIILGIQTNDTTHMPVKSLSSKLFAYMQTKYNGDHRPLLPAMLPAGNAPADANALVDSTEGPSVAPDASAKVDVDAQPPPSPRPSTPGPPTPTPSPGVDAPTEHVAPEDFGPDQPIHTPQITRLATPSPLRPTYEGYEDLDAGFYNSPVRTNDAPNTTDIPAGGTEGPVTLTSMCTLLDRYVKKVDDLEKELKETKANLGGQIDMLTAKVKDLAQELQAKYDSEIQSATHKYVSTLNIARQRELDAAVPNFDEADWMHIGQQVVSNPVLARVILGDNVSEADYAPRMVELMKLRRKADAEMIAKAKRDKPLSQAQQKKMMREFVKNQSSAVYNNPWTKTQVWSLSDDQLIHQYNLIKTRLHKDGLLGSPQPHSSTQSVDTKPSFQGLKIGDATDTEPSPSVDNTSSADQGAHIADPAHAISVDPSTDVSADHTPADNTYSFDKGKAKVVEEDIPSRKRSRRQMEEDRLGEEAAQILHKDQIHEEKVRLIELEAARAKQARLDMESQQVHVLPSAMDYAIPPLAPSSAATHDPSAVTHEPAVTIDEPYSPHSAIYIPGRRAKRMARIKTSKSPHVKRELDFNADDASFLEEGSPEDCPEGFLNVLVRWEVSSNGQSNTIYTLDGSSMPFTFLQEILHLVDHQDVLTLYDLVTKYYANHTPEGAGLYLLGDFQVLMDSESSTGFGYAVWNNNHRWKVLSWRFYPVPYVHVLEITSRIRVAMFIDRDYPLTVTLMEKMLLHHLEIPPDPVGNARLFAESLIRLFKSRIRAARAP
jgi:hypothetical protein